MTRVLASRVSMVFFMPQSDSVREMSIFMIRSIPLLLKICTTRTRINLLTYITRSRNNMNMNQEPLKVTNSQLAKFFQEKLRHKKLNKPKIS